MKDVGTSKPKQKSEIEDIARVVVMKKMFVTSNMTEALYISSLLGQSEPYHSLPLSVVYQLFDNSKVSQHIPEHVFREIQERCKPIMDIYPVTRQSSTYQSVRDHLSRFSVFDTMITFEPKVYGNPSHIYIFPFSF